MLTGPIKQALRAARAYEQVRMYYLAWSQGQAVSFYYYNHYEPVPIWGPIPSRKFFETKTDTQRPEKIRLLHLLDFVASRLYRGWESIPGMPSEQDFRGKLDASKTKLLRKEEAHFNAIRSITASRLTRILESNDFLNAFELITPIEKMDVLTRVTEGLVEMPIGVMFLKEAARSGFEPQRLLDPERIKRLPSSLGIDVGNENHPEFTFYPEAEVEAKNYFVASTALDAMKQTMQVYQLFSSSVLPIVIYTRLLNTGILDDEGMQIADAVLMGLLPEGVVDVTAPRENKRRDAINYLNNNKNEYLLLADNFISTMSGVLNIYNALLSLHRIISRPTFNWDSGAEAANVIANTIAVTAAIAKASLDAPPPAGAAATTTGIDLAMRRVRIMTAGSAVLFLAVDTYAFIKGISTAQDFSNPELLASHAVKFAGAGISAAVTVYGTLLPAGVGLGPAGWLAIGSGVGLMLLGGWLITVTQNPPLVNYAATCWFSKQPAGSTDKADLHYGFFKIGANVPDLDQPDLNEQLDRLHTMLQPLGFKVENNIIATISFNRYQTGPQSLPNGTDFRLSMLDGTAHPLNITDEAFAKLREDGVVAVPSFAGALHGEWITLEAILPQPTYANELFGPAGGKVRQIRLVEYQQI